MFNDFIIVILIAVIVDVFLGDPYGFYHPVRMIGGYITFFEKNFYKDSVLRGGILLVSTAAISVFCYIAFSSVGWIAGVIAAWTFLSVKSLASEGMKVYVFLQEGDLVRARKALAMIVTRDTSSLDSAQISRAVIETLSENFVDGVLSPIIYLVLFGIPGCALYKSVSTLDSMVGYRTKKYEKFGKLSARADDLLNFLPARIAAFVVIPLASVLTGNNPLRCYKTVIKDRLKHESPNSAHSEAAFAGSLGVALGGSSVYHGKLENKPAIGAGLRSPEPAHIKKAVILMYASSFTGLIIFLAIRYLSGVK